MAMFQMDRARLERNLRESGLNDEATRAIIELIDQGIKEAVREQFQWVRFVKAGLQGAGWGLVWTFAAFGFYSLLFKVLG